MMALGMAVRIPVHNDPTSIPTYSVSTLLTLLSPCAFIAQDYYVLPKLAEWADADDCLFLQPRLVGRIFLISDAVTFFLQMSGSGMGAVASMASIGDKVDQRPKSASTDLRSPSSVLSPNWSHSLFSLSYSCGSVSRCMCMAPRLELTAANDTT